MKQIRIGNQTACSSGSIEEPFNYAVLNGFDAFEWFPDRNEAGRGWAVEDMDAAARSRIRGTAVERDIALSVHASLQADPLDIEAHGLIIKEIRFARDVGARLLNLHLHAHRGIEHYVEVILPVLNQAGRAGIDLSIENTPLTTPQDFNRLFSLLREIQGTGKGRVGMCFDMGHANLCSVTRNDFLGFMDRLSEKIPITHIHMHENYGDYDAHYSLFTGPAGSDSAGIEGMIQRLKKRQFSGSFILEQWPEPPSLLNNARDGLMRLWNEV